MEIRPILSAMRRNKVGPLLIAAQMAMTLAILCNSLFIVVQRIAWSNRLTGTDEGNIFVIVNQWLGHPTDLTARLQSDLAALRAVPGVIDAFASNSYVLKNGGSSEGVKLSPDQAQSITETAVYYGDDHALRSLGLKLVAGRNFSANEIADKVDNADVVPAAVIVTSALAERLFPGKSALGRRLILDFLAPGNPGISIVGVVDRLQVPWVDPWSKNINDYSVIVPFRFVSQVPANYIVRTQPGQLTAVLRAAETKLFDINPGRVLVKSLLLTEARADAYKDDRGLAIILVVVSTALVSITAFGIVGLTSYWVVQRRRQIGIRRALGATRQAIVAYFQTENLLITAVGAAIGVGLAVSANLWMVNAFATQRLQGGYPFAGVIVVLLLGQVATLWPALKAASIPPALATRGA
jgi:putative ABC transport system permease protein